jgi:hypothetical protein
MSIQIVQRDILKITKVLYSFDIHYIYMYVCMYNQIGNILAQRNYILSEAILIYNHLSFNIQCYTQRESIEVTNKVINKDNYCTKYCWSDVLTLLKHFKAATNTIL